MPGKNAVDVYLSVGLRWRDFAQLEQPIFKAYYFLTVNIQTISKTKTYVKNKLAGRLYQTDLELKVPLRSNSITRILGHNSTASVEKTYAHLLQESAEVDLEKCMKEAFEKR